MNRFDWYTRQIELCKAAYAVSEGCVKSVIRAYLVELLVTVCEMTGREGQEIVE